MRFPGTAFGHDEQVTIAYIAACAAALLYGVSAVMEDIAAKRVPVTGHSGKRAAVQTTLAPLYLAGMGLSILAWASTIIALHTLPLFAVQALAASSIGIVVLIAWARGGHRPSRRVITLLIVLAVGLAALALSAAPSRPHRPTLSFHIAIWIGVAFVVLAAVWASKVPGARGSALLAGVSGLADGGMALCARAIHLHPHHRLRLLLDPLALALVPFAVIGIIAFAGALQRGNASIALACQQAALTVIPSAIGLAALGDRSRHGFIAVTYIGFVVTIAAVLGLTLSTSSDSERAPSDEVGDAILR